VGAHARVRMTACPLRTGGDAPTKKPHPAPAPVGAPARVRMAARPVRTGAVLLQQNTTQPPPPRRGTRPACARPCPPFAPRSAPGAVLLQNTLTQPPPP